MIAHLLDSRKGSIFILEITEVSREMDAQTISQLVMPRQSHEVVMGNTGRRSTLYSGRLQKGIGNDFTE